MDGRINPTTQFSGEKPICRFGQEDTANLAVSTTEKCDELAKFFHSRMTDPRDVDNSQEYDTMMANILRKIHTSPFDNVFTEPEVFKVLKDLKKNKAPGRDGLQPDLFYKIPNSLSLLTSLLNSIVETHTIPSILLGVNVIPLNKPNKSMDLCEHFRPISLIGKIFAQILHLIQKCQ